MSIVELEAVTRRYGDLRALDGVTLRLEENRIHGLLGRNGAGKTTVMRIVTAQEFASSGTVRVFGEDPYENARVLDRVCFVREAQRYPDTFRVRHALEAARLAYPGWDASLASDLVGEFGLRPRQRIKKLSRGQLSAVGVTIGLASRAPLTLFDEPYLGLDAVARQLFYDRLLADFAEHPRTVVLSTHLIDEVSDLIEHVVVIDRGAVLVDEEAEQLRGSAVVVSGPVADVEALVAGHEVLHRERLGGLVRTTVRVRGPHGLRPTPNGAVSVEPLSLQQLVVRATQANARPADPDAPPLPGTAEGATEGKVLQS